MRLNPSNDGGPPRVEGMGDGKGRGDRGWARWIGVFWVGMWMVLWGWGVNGVEAGIEPAQADKGRSEVASKQVSTKHGSSPEVASTPTPTAEASAPGLRWQAFLGPFHTLILHYPIGFLTLVFILELYGLRRPSTELGQITSLVIGLSFFSGVLAATLGVMRANSGGYEPRTLDIHRWCGIAVPFLTLLTWWLHTRWRASLSQNGRLWGYRSALGVTLLTLGVAGHFGGNLTHGAQYLTENAPPFLKALLEPRNASAPDTQTNTESTKKEDHRVVWFREKVQPVFEQKCYRCHGEEKQKGGYRMDQPVTALKGGESGRAAIQPNDPMNSEVVRLIMLPRTDDSAMPPEGKEPVTPEEILNIVRWIQEGAVFPK